jgi:hypothetical protein
MAGTAPAALLAGLPLANGWRASSPFDLRWAALHLLFAALLWHAVGRAAEGHGALMRASKCFLLLRGLSAPVSLSFWGNWAAMLAHTLLLAFWGAAVLWLLGFAARWSVRRLRTGS